MPFYVGLDLGHSADFTALAIVHQVPTLTALEDDRPQKDLHLRHLERYPLRTPYPDIAQNVATLQRLA